MTTLSTGNHAHSWTSPQTRFGGYATLTTTFDVVLSFKQGRCYGACVKQRTGSASCGENLVCRSCSHGPRVKARSFCPLGVLTSSALGPKGIVATLMGRSFECDEVLYDWCCVPGQAKTCTDGSASLRVAQPPLCRPSSASAAWSKPTLLTHTHSFSWHFPYTTG